MATNKFDSMFNIAALREEVSAASNSTGEREEIPDGDYCVAIDRIVMGETRNGDPAMKVTFVVRMPGEHFDRRFIFYTQMMDNGVGVSVALAFLKKITVGMEDSIVFESFTQFEELLNTISEMTKGWLYSLTYGTNNRGYKFYKVNGMEAE